LGRGTRRRGHTARTGGGGRGGSAPVMTRARPGQQVAHEGPIVCRKAAWAVARPWEVEGAQLDGGGVDSAVGRQCQREEGRTRGIYRGGLAGVTAA
jgi:hypothetical protein